MIVCVHFPNLDDPPVGIWWEQDGIAQAYYPESGAASTMGQQIFASRNRSLPLADFFQTLADRQPYPMVWEKMETPPDYDPEEYLDTLRRVAFEQIEAS